MSIAMSKIIPVLTIAYKINTDLSVVNRDFR